MNLIFEVSLKALINPYFWPLGLLTIPLGSPSFPRESVGTRRNPQGISTNASGISIIPQCPYDSVWDALAIPVITSNLFGIPIIP